MVVDNNGAAMAVREEHREMTVADPEQAAAALNHILATGDLSKLSNDQRRAFYLQRCASLGLNSLSRPFDWLMLDGKLVLYENKSCAEQLRRQHQISCKITRAEVVGGDTKEPMYVVTVEGRRPNGQTDEATKYVPLSDSRGRLTGKNLANAYAKAESGAKRRLTFSMVGMAAPPDPDEMQGARYVVVDGTGRIIDRPTDMQKALAADPAMARVIGEPRYEDADAADSPLVATASQAVRPDEITPPVQPRRQVSLHCDANRWRAAYFGATADTALETAEGRRAFMSAYTAEWTAALRTDSLSAFLARATDQQAEEMVMVAQIEADGLRDAAHEDARQGPFITSEGEEPLDEDAQIQGDIEAEMERDRAATQQAAF